MSEAILKVDGVSKRFGSLQATDNVSLDLVPGEIHALIGPNGAGKSTLIKQIVGELPQDSGSVSFDGIVVDRLNAPSRAKLGMARTFQISSLALEVSALHNVMLAIQARSGQVFRFFKPVMSETSLTEPALESLEKVGLEAKADVKTSDLSHGERRKLEIAIALAMQPKAFLMDEPMAGMGPEGSKQLTEYLDGLRYQAPILLVEHDMDAVFQLANRISVLVYGAIIATGTADEIRANPLVREAYLGDEADD
ncbi:MAG: ABC transporter ATP-binding protein [Pseudomonadota bacterium]